MKYNDSKTKEVIVNIEIGEASHEGHAESDPVAGHRWGEKSLSKLLSGVLGFTAGAGPTTKPIGISSGLVDPNETMKMSVDKNYGQSQGPVEKEEERDLKKAGKVKKSPKPPRPPRGPSLDAADMRLIKEISKIAMKKRERIERIKALKKMKAAKSPSSSSSSSSSSSLSSSGSTISAMVITILFFLVLIVQGLGSSTSSSLALMGAPQPTPETRGLLPFQVYVTVLSDDGAAPGFVPSKSTQ